MNDWKYRLKQAREAKDLNKTTFAKLVGVSNATVTDWEKSADEGGIKELSAPSLTKIYEVLDVDLYWLISGKGRNPIPSDLGQPPAQKMEVPQSEPTQQVVDAILRQATEMIDTYRLASPTDRQRIDYALGEARKNFPAHDKAKPRAR